MGHSVIASGGVHFLQPQSQRGRGYCRPTQSKTVRPSTRQLGQWVAKTCAPSITNPTKINDSSVKARNAKVLAQNVKVNNMQVEFASTETHKTSTNTMVAPIASQEQPIVECDFTQTPEISIDDRVVPFTSQEVADGRVVEGLSVVLTCWIQTTARIGKPPKVSHFHSVSLPGLSIKDYLKRIYRFFNCSLECYAIALVLIDRAGKADPTLAVCDLNVHRLLVTAVMLAAKFHDDEYYGNNYYAKVGGVALKEMNNLEAKLLALLDWKVNVTPEEYEEYLKHVRTAIRLDIPAEATPPVEKKPKPEL